MINTERTQIKIKKKKKKNKQRSHGQTKTIIDINISRPVQETNRQTQHNEIIQPTNDDTANSSANKHAPHTTTANLSIFNDPR